jgi:hypothetical protein
MAAAIQKTVKAHVMKRKRIAVAVTCTLAVGVIVFVCVARDNLYFFGYLEGRLEARQEIKRDSMTIYVYGDMSRAMLAARDTPTGLPKKAIAGCVMNQRMLGKAKGHNTVIRRHLVRK